MDGTHQQPQRLSHKRALRALSGRLARFCQDHLMIRHSVPPSEDAAHVTPDSKFTWTSPSGMLMFSAVESHVGRVVPLTPALILLASRLLAGEEKLPMRTVAIPTRMSITMPIAISPNGVLLYCFSRHGSPQSARANHGPSLSHAEVEGLSDNVVGCWF